MSNMVTRCPQCQTSFKVTEEHLKIANGAVRCGACLHVFQARQHWADPANVQPPRAAAPSAAPQPATPSPEPAKAAGKFLFDQSAIDNSSAGALLDEPDARIPETALTRAHASATPARKLDELGSEDLISDDLGLEDDEPDTHAPAHGDNGGFGDPDDDYSALFDEVAEDNSEGDEFDSLLRGDFNDLEELSGNAPDESGTGTADESWAKELLNELHKEDEPEALDLSQVDDVRKILTDFTNPVDVDAARKDLGFDQRGPFDARDLSGEKPARAAMLAHIEPAPVELLPGQYHGRQAAWKDTLLWSGVCLLLALGLAGQHTFFHFHQLSQQESTRPLLQSLCQVVRCTLPPMENWRHIKISNLLVRQHPQVADALAVDAILLNTTGSDLAFPSLELYFNSMEQLPVASRRFAPAEYLAGEMTGKSLIPPGRPVHIAFEIVKPGDEAVNWSLQVARREP